MRRAALLTLALLAAGCGVDGPPVAPSAIEPEDRPAGRTPTVMVSGTAGAGIAGRL